jgi:hypothetical protein
MGNRHEVDWMGEDSSLINSTESSRIIAVLNPTYDYRESSDWNGLRGRVQGFRTCNQSEPNFVLIL